MKFLRLTLIILIVTLTGVIFAGLRELPYTGQIYSGSSPLGGALGQNQQFYFKIYDAQSGGNLLWQSGSIITQFVKNGFLSINLGDTNVMNAMTESIFNQVDSLWLEIQTAALGNSLSTLSPRKKIRTAAYTFDANRLDGISASQYMRKWTNVVVVSPLGTAGGADFDTITAAIADASGRATTLNKYTVLVLPGIYTLDPTINDAPNVDIIGLDRDNCIIYGTLNINNSILVENLTFDLSSMGGTAIDIFSGTPTLNNIKIIEGTTGINIQTPAVNTVVHNVECVQTTVAINDNAGIIIDELRADKQTFSINLSDPAARFNYKNILQTSSDAVFGQITSGAGSIRSIKAKNSLNIIYCGNLKIRDAHIKTQGNDAISISNIEPYSKIEIYDAIFETDTGKAAQVGNIDEPMLIESPVLFNDVKFISMSGDGINAYYITNITVEDCEINAGENGINCQNNNSGNAAVQLYVQSTKINAGNIGINLSGATEAWIYDTTIKCSANSVRGNMTTPMTPSPRIADCKFETDTSPSQGTGTPGWNALMPLSGAGNVGGLGEDTAGNIIAPAAGLPIMP